MQSPFFHYNPCFDPVALIEKYKCKQQNASPSHVVNFLGLKINPEFMPECVRHLRGQVEPPPNPANWHSDISEFGAVFHVNGARHPGNGDPRILGFALKSLKIGS